MPIFNGYSSPRRRHSHHYSDDGGGPRYMGDGDFEKALEKYLSKINIWSIGTFAEFWLDAEAALDPDGEHQQSMLKDRAWKSYEELKRKREEKYNALK